ncbi:Hsp33 family molecular chaperone HslO [Thorsellia anophelis]|uniref:33 kDa chaperonin n=1 Tax=Thorsellia anophelis DSM 18579 TaxID=1123402 RepID=A0A1H9Y442_9GAMM|nr:Hsp33 family molecular chaperone HslO [Thorsellia anophelis]SES63107.1 molecular chaperone Hsp33 [Thorsellia anophelis DSM 18579]
MSQDLMLQSQKTDQLYRFLFDEHAARGELVTVTHTLNAMLEHHNYPVAIQKLLGELVVATSLLTATLKFEGDITVQLQGDGPISMLVINGNNHQQMRGTVKYDESIAFLPESNIETLFGRGYIVITVMPKDGERYQGIVELEGHSIASCLERYFTQSEQLETRLFLFSQMHEGVMHAAGMFLQVMPGQVEKDEYFFDSITQLTHTIKAEELFNLPVEEILNRLYHEEIVRLYDPQPVSFFCHCSEEKCYSAMATLGDEEIESLLNEQKLVTFNCDFCGKAYEFDADMINTALKRNLTN